MRLGDMLIPKDTNTIEMWLKEENISYKRGTTRNELDICILTNEFSSWGELTLSQILYLIALKRYFEQLASKEVADEDKN